MAQLKMPSRHKVLQLDLVDERPLGGSEPTSYPPLNLLVGRNGGREWQRYCEVGEVGKVSGWVTCNSVQAKKQRQRTGSFLAVQKFRASSPLGSSPASQAFLDHWAAGVYSCARPLEPGSVTRRTPVGYWKHPRRMNPTGRMLLRWL